MSKMHQCVKLGQGLVRALLEAGLETISQCLGVTGVCCLDNFYDFEGLEWPFSYQDIFFTDCLDAHTARSKS